jgi:hypothetical protein
LSVDLNLNILTLLNVVNVVLSGVLNFPVLVVHFPLFSTFNNVKIFRLRSTDN